MAKILVMDDHEKLCETVRRILEREHEVVVAYNGKRGIAMFTDEGADLVLVDLNMPEMDGMEVIQELRRIQPGLRIIAMSGGGRYSPDVNLRTAELLGADTILKKPFDHEELRQMVQRALA